jgi:hypothetical protein
MQPIQFLPWKTSAIESLRLRRIRCSKSWVLILFFCLGSLSLVDGYAQSVHKNLKVSENHRFLVYDDGQPFFYLGDTAWELFHRLKREEVDIYLQDRAGKGFTVIQAVAIAELEGHTVPNPYGYLPLTNLDPARPAVKDGPENDYWDGVDYVVRKANDLGLIIGFLPTWGRYWHDKVKDGKPLFNKANAAAYGEWLGKRYKDSGLIWILGGDRPVENEEQKAVIRAMAAGLKKGDGGTHLITFHPPGGNGSSTWFQDADWLDFNMRQNGHQIEFTGRYDKTHADYERTPVKPVIDGEPIYEDHPVSFNPDHLGHSVAADVRRAMYWDLFGGACGHTYGHHSVWQMYDPARGHPINRPLMPWFEAIHQPGAGQMQFGRRLIESRPFLTRIPDDSIIVPSAVASSVPGAGTRRFSGTRDEKGSYAMIYAPVGRKFSVRMGALHAQQVRAWWFNPRNGAATEIGTFQAGGTREFTPPDYGEELDWVLVLDDLASNYPPPGTARPSSR